MKAVIILLLNWRKSFPATRKRPENIGTLKKYNLLKTVRNDKPEYSDLSDQDIVIGEVPDDSSEFSYIFSFVGVILLDDLVLLCYPKYIDNDEEPFDKLKTVIKVIEKYNQKEQLVHLYNGEDASSSTALPFLSTFCMTILKTDCIQIRRKLSSLTEKGKSFGIRQSMKLLLS